jgi:hypothetical protein
LFIINYFFLLLAALILSIRLGYGRPAALAIAFAFDLAFEESFLGFAFGLGLSQTCFLLAIIYFFPLFLLEIAAAFFLASALEDAPQALSESNSLVGSPFGFLSGPGMLPILAKKEALRGLSPDLTGAFKFIPCLFAEARPLALSPPLGFFPAFVCHAGDLAITFSFSFY